MKAILQERLQHPHLFIVGGRTAGGSVDVECLRIGPDRDANNLELTDVIRHRDQGAERSLAQRESHRVVGHPTIKPHSRRFARFHGGHFERNGRAAGRFLSDVWRRTYPSDQDGDCDTQTKTRCYSQAQLHNNLLRRLANPPRTQ